MLDYERVTAPLSLIRTGSGEPLLLLHGLGTSRRDFTAVLPALTDRFDVINVDLPGIGRSPHLEQRPTVAAITDAVEHTLDAQGLDRVHVLGNSLGARIALELAVRGRARSVVAIAPSGVNIPQERLYQGATMGLARIVMRAAQPLIASVSRSSAGRAALLAPLKARPWSTSPEEAIGVREGFAESRDFGRTVLWALMLDVPRGLDRIDCPVTLVQGVADWVAAGQTVRYLPLIAGSRFSPLLMAGHAPQSDRPATIARLVEETATRAAGRTATLRAIA
ncbi:alpha/beta hydrolase [Mycobacterium sp.]|uniref:alpha/beta fold hydrolase n=1 Tax=Mycobacterium sp. TaxID=1785 RepID=UPI002C1723AB|nr:alpha/beta hydrolase [Mycobacterium sp.]HTH87328.1 alpha/beta hydrolase [Mycobacterium sp.]